MQAMVFAAGLGTRLKPWTLTHPKALVEVGGEPVLGRALSALKRAGVSRVVVNVHHFADQVCRYIDTHSAFGLDVRISDETDLLRDTGGGLLHARALFLPDEPIMLYNADIVTDMPLEVIRLQGDVTLACSQRDSSRRLCFDSSGRLTGWADLRNGQTRGIVTADSAQMAFNGIHIVHPSVLDRLAAYGREVFSLTPFYVDMAGMLDIRMFDMDRWHWFDVGKPETLQRARQWAG